MKINKYKKLKTNTYKLVLDNKEEIVLYDDTIIKYDLLRTKEINDLDSIIKYNKSIESYYIAIKYITRKLRTEKEVRNKLIDYPSKAIDNTIERLIKEGYINDKNYLKISIKDYINITSYGPNKIVYKLIPLGFTKEEIYNELDNYDREIFIDKLDKLIDKFSDDYYKSGKFVIFITTDSSDIVGFVTKKLKIKDIIFILRKLLEETYRIPDKILNNYF